MRFKFATKSSLEKGKKEKERKKETPHFLLNHLFPLAANSIEAQEEALEIIRTKAK